MNLLQITVYASLFVQVLTGIADVYAVQLPIAPEYAILTKLVWIELIVQVVEGIFYVWFAASFSRIKNVTPSRYYDWILTTPTMLVTLCIYLDFINQTELKNVSYPTSLLEALQRNTVLVPILLLNWLMLLFGYLGEVRSLPTMVAVGLGFLPFLLYFGIIYERYAKFTVTGQTLFWVFAAIWALYGVSAMLSYYWKNIGYNILDLFAKNFFGIFLAYVVLEKYH